MRWNPTELPWIGCFGLSSGSSAKGSIAGHEFEVSVDPNGREVLKAEGVIVVEAGPRKEGGRHSNVPYVKITQQFSFCSDNGDRCDVDLRIMSRNPDKSVYFYFSRRVFGNAFVTTEENWDAEQNRLRRQNP